MRGLLQSIIDEQGFCISDGGLGSELAEAGALDPELWSGGAALPPVAEDGSLDLRTRTANQVRGRFLWGDAAKRTDNDKTGALCALSGQQTLSSIHERFYASGADICSTSSYQLSHEGLARKGFTPEQADQVLALTADIACEARDRFWASYQAAASAGGPRRARPLVAASVGCYGACLPGGVEFTGVYDKGTDELIDWHRRRFFVLANVSKHCAWCAAVQLA